MGFLREPNLCPKIYETAKSKLDALNQLLFILQRNVMVNYYDFCLRDVISDKKCDNKYLKMRSVLCRAFVSKLWYEFEMARIQLEKQLFNPFGNGLRINMSESVCLKRYENAKLKSGVTNIFEGSNPVGRYMEFCLLNYGVKNKYCTMKEFRDEIFMRCSNHIFKEYRDYEKVVSRFEELLGVLF